ncbi:MAG TPA: ABC transporter ATP-binding protein [Burkholderiaceae bacterium]|jgi:capsular polysaccharide transport system ATP-binding protein|nr:ABC transporter ATP-binding protein [Burkholderiaceae bacterium]
MLELRNLTKWYSTLHGRRYVFRDLNFDFPPEASIGLIGRNGAGKSTLLRLLGGIDVPNAGAVVTDARISWPVGLSGGFQTALTARENVQFVCRVHGATGSKMRRIIDFIADFAEIGDYFDLPMNSYSSGMRSRVAFGMSMAFDFDYYLIDEVTAVGDPQFKSKSQALLRERLKRSRVIMVSHAMPEIEKFCDVVVHVDRGRTALYEDVKQGIAAYQLQAQPEAKPAPAPLALAATSGAAKLAQAIQTPASAGQK